MNPANNVKEPEPPGSRGQKLFIITLRCGRLANRLIIFATFIAMVEEYGHRLVNFTFHSYAGFFEKTRRDIFCGYPAAKRRSWMDLVPGLAAAIRKTRIFYHVTRLATVLNERHPVFGNKLITLRGIKGRRATMLDDPEIREKIRNAKIVFVYEWGFRATELIQKHAEKIRDYFHPVEEVESSSREAVESLRRVADIVVGVHIRQGDYRRWKGGRYFFPVAQYAVWMNEMAAQFPGRKVSFLVCSDEPRDAGEFPGLSVGFGGASPVVDLYALSKCDYIIGTVSTFSQWASFYGGKPMLHFHDRNDRIAIERFRVSYLDLIE